MLVRLSYIKMQFLYSYRCRSKHNEIFLFSAKLAFTPNIWEILESKWHHWIDVIKLHNFASMQVSRKRNIFVVNWERNLIDLNSDGIFGPQNREKKFLSQIIVIDKTEFRCVISMPESHFVTIFMSCVEILTKP